MILVALLIGVILVVASFRNTQGSLFAALATDVPGFVIWAAAIIALGAIGWVPDLKPISRGLLILVILVIVMRNYQQIIAGFQAVAAPAAPASPATAAATAPATVATPTPVPASVAPASSTNAFGSLDGITAGSFGGTLDASNPWGLLLTGTGQ